MKTSAQTVIVGAGIVGVSAAWELAKRGCTDLLVIDQSELFRTGGSTSHAPGGVFQNNASRTVSKLAQWSVETFLDISAEGTPTYFPVSSLEIATTEARWTDLHRKVGYANSWGLDGRLLGPEETGDLLPWLDTRLIYGSIQIGRDGIVRAVPTVERIAKRAESLGVAFAGGVRLTGVRTGNGRVTGAETDAGVIACERLVLCGGIWGPLLGEITGVRVPIQPCAHPYVRSAPLPQLTGLTEVEHPVWRHQDHSMYLWQDGARLGVGNYRHEPFLVDAANIRNDVASPAEISFDMRMMEPGIREAERLLPSLAGFPVEDRVYGMFSFTPDGNSLLGEIAHVPGLWTAMAVWVTHAPGAGRALAQMMEEGSCELDSREIDVNRFAPHQTARSFVHTRGGQQYREVYDIIHPRQQIDAPRTLRRSPWYEQQCRLDAVFAESNGWERPLWFEANHGLPRPLHGVNRDGWSEREWSPICASEHVATRSTAGLFDMSTFMRIEISGGGAVAALEYLTCSRVDRPVGRVTYSLLLNDRGGIESDVTIARMAPDRFMIMSGSASGPRDLSWVETQTRHTPDIQIHDTTAGWCAMGVWGPQAPALLSSIAEEPVDAAAIPPFRFKSAFFSGIPVLAINMSYVGEPGLELHTTTDYGAALYDAVWSAGKAFGLVAAGSSAMDTLRLETGYRALGTDLRAEYSPEEAGLGFAVDQSRSNWSGHRALGSRQPEKRLTCLTFDDLSIMPLGKEPVYVDGVLAGYLTSAGFGYTVGRGIAYAYLPAGMQKSVCIEFEYFGKRFPALVSPEPLLLARSTGAVVDGR